MVHLSDLDWKRPGEQVIEEYKKGDKVKAQVLDVDVEKERISLGIKQLAGDPFAGAAGELKKGAVVTCEVTEVKEGGIDVKIVGTELTAFIKRVELARDRSEQRPERFAGRPEGRCPRHPVRPPRPQGRASRSRRWKSPRRRRRSPSTARPIPARRSATSSAPRSSASARKNDDRGRRPPDAAASRDGVASRVSFATIAAPCGAPLTMTAARPRALSATMRSNATSRRHAMSLDADLIVDRRRMRRKLTFWRVLAVLVADRRRSSRSPPRSRGAASPADGRRRLHRARQDHRADPQRPGAGRGARAARQVAAPRR